MARTPATFRQADLVRAVKSAKACGLEIVRTEIAPDGRITLIHERSAEALPSDPFGAWEAKRNARAS